jgi:hypothetical protein
LLAGNFRHFSEGRLRQPSTMRKASQVILQASPATLATPRTSPRPCIAHQATSPTRAMRRSTSGSGSRQPMRKSLSGKARPIISRLLCLSGAPELEPPRSFESNDSDLHFAEESSLICSECATGSSCICAAKNGASSGTPKDGFTVEEGRRVSGSSLKQTYLPTCEPRVIYEDPERFVLAGGKLDTQWVREMENPGSAYMACASREERWFLLPHEAVAALRMQVSLSL